jgi:hypothetical protein
MIRVIVYRSADFDTNVGIAEMFAQLDKATLAGKAAGLDYKFTVEDNGWVYWYEFETEAEAALFKLTYL